MDTFNIQNYIMRTKLTEAKVAYLKLEDGSVEQVEYHDSVSSDSIKMKHKPGSDYYGKKVVDIRVKSNMPSNISEVISAFDPDTQKTLSKKSADSLEKMLKGKSFMQASQDAMRLLPEIMEIEAPYRDQLEQLAKEVMYSMFPIVEKAGIDIDAKLVTSPGEMKITKNQDEEEAEEEDLDAVAEKSGIDKRRIINAITQGASLRGTKAYYLFDEVIEALSPGLMQKYEQLVADSYGIYDDDNAIAMMMAMLAQGGATQGGESEVDWNEDEDTMTIKATALVFPILMQEIVKGLYEFVSLQGFTGDAEKNKAIVKTVDKVTSEPEDIRYGKFIYDSLNNMYIDSNIDNPVVRELFFAEVYKLDDSEFKIFIENAINDNLTSTQKRWVDKTLQQLDDENK